MTKERKQKVLFRDTFLEKPEEGHQAFLMTLAMLGLISLLTIMTAAGVVYTGRAGVQRTDSSSGVTASADAVPGETGKL